MLNHARLWFVGFLALLVATPPLIASPSWKAGSPQRTPATVTTLSAGQVFCPPAALVYGGIFIPGGQCYLLSVLRNTGGTFLAFAPPGSKIPPGQLVRLNTPAGPKLKGRLFLVPLRTDVALVPVNTVTVVATRVEDFGPQVAIVLLNTPVPGLTVIFNVHL